MAFKNNEITTKEIGELLIKEYPGNNDDCVNYFWIMITKRDKDFDQSELRAVEECLMKTTELKNWARLKDTVQCGKHTMYFVECNKNGRKERDRELALNKEIRKPIKDGENLSIIIMRACSYLFEEDPMEID